MNSFSVNVCICTCCIMILTVLIISQLSRHTRDRQNRLFLLMLLIYMAVMIGELAAWLSEGYSGVARTVQYLSNDIAYIAGAWFYPVFFEYLYVDASRESRISGIPAFLFAVTVTLSALTIIVTVCNHFIPILYTINDMNIWVPEKGAVFLNDFRVFVQQLLLIILIAVHKDMDQRYRIRIAAYCLLTMSAAVYDIMHFYCALIYPATVLELLLIYLNFQLITEQEIEKTELEIAKYRFDQITGRMRPHFVDDMLKQIEQLCRDDSEKAQWAVNELSEYLRGNVDRTGFTETIPFSKELEHVRHYMNLVRLRYPDMHMEEEIQVHSFRIPARVVLTAVEQSIIACISLKQKSSRITIRTFSDDCIYFIEIISPAFQQEFDIEDRIRIYMSLKDKFHSVNGAKIILYSDLQCQTHMIFSIPEYAGGTE